MVKKKLTEKVEKVCLIGSCKNIDIKKSQHSACYRQNGVYCTKYNMIRPKYSSCLDDNLNFQKLWKKSKK